MDVSFFFYKVICTKTLKKIVEDNVINCNTYELRIRKIDLKRKT